MRTRRSTPFAALCLLMGALAACGEGSHATDPEGPSLTGEWIGTLRLSSTVSTVISLSLQETDGAVSGSGTWAASGNGLSLPVSIREGVFTSPRATFVIQQGSSAALPFTGTLSSDGMSLQGEVNGGSAGFLALGFARR
ncbi:MAG: hypothetical protein R3E10_13475 [Gemmatimonadota bacterium]